MKHAASLGAGDHLHFHSPAIPEEMARLAAVYDAGLVAEDGATLNRQIALTNKQFTYLLAGIPAMMSDIPAHLEFASGAGDAVITYRVNNSESLAAEMDALFSDSRRLADRRAHAFGLGQGRFNWEAEAPNILDRVSRALGSRENLHS
jgi:hypothetical protein